jgi:glycosyltransferase involved in cell wall biosynthesis
MLDITAVLLTYNERENIERTMTALLWVERLLIIDSFSTDDTLARARALRPDVTVLQRTFDTFAEQCNFGLSHVATPWVLSLDADYVVTRELADEVQTLEPADEVSGYFASFRYCVFGNALRTTIYPPRTILYRRDRAHYENEGHGHKVHVPGVVQSLRGKIEHDDRKPLSRWIVAQNGYSIVEARYLLAASPEKLSAPDRVRKRVFFAPTAVFFYLLLGKGLILDGWRGWYYVCQRTIAEMLLSLRLLTEREGLERGPKSSGRIS